jgi:hypothetical protein
MGYIPPIVFPHASDPSYGDVSAWITFHAAKYSTFSSNRTPEAVIANAHTSITLPYPGIFNTQNQQEYSNMPTPQIKMLELGVFGSLQQSLLGTIEKAESFIRGRNVMTFDHMETVLTPGGRRTHRFEFNLIGKTEQSIGEITNAALTFQTLMHPGADTSSIYTQTHPSVWVFTAGSLGDGATKVTYGNDRAALDGFGLTSVLTSVDINRAPIENIPYMVQTQWDNAFFPVAVNIKLNFIELEPALNDGSGAQLNRMLINRSQRRTS